MPRRKGGGENRPLRGMRGGREGEKGRAACFSHRERRRRETKPHLVVSGKRRLFSCGRKKRGVFCPSFGGREKKRGKEIGLGGFSFWRRPRAKNVEKGKGKKGSQVHLPPAQWNEKKEMTEQVLTCISR